MTDPIEQINNISNMEDFLNFVIQLAKDAKEHPEEWTNTTITDYLGQIASWIDDCYLFEDKINFEKLDYKVLAKILYMGKIYGIISWRKEVLPQPTSGSTSRRRD